MKSFIADLLPRVQQYSKKLDNVALFTEEPWVHIGDSQTRTVYYFRREDNELLVSRNGDVMRGAWTYLAPLDSLLIEVEGEQQLYNQGFLDKSVMILAKDGAPEYLLMANESRIGTPSVEKLSQYLKENYLEAGRKGRVDQPGRTEARQLEDKQEYTPAYLGSMYVVIFIIVIVLLAVIGSG